MRIVSFFTPGEIYSLHEAELRESVVKFAPLAFYRTTPVMDTGSWVKNCALKPKVIQTELEKTEPGDRLLYVDVDARVRAPLDELALHARWPRADPPFDVGLHINMRGGQPEVLSGTLLFCQTPAAVELVDRWALKCQERPEVWDQRHLAAAIAEMVHVKVWDFGPEYVFIHDTFRRRYPDKKPVIEHFQASRKARSAKQPTR